MSTPFYSIIIPTYNRASFLKKCLKTVCVQTFTDFECIVIDDGSTDNTEEYVQSIDDERVIYVKKENEGPAAARNRGLEIAKGEWMAFLDSDDWWEPNKLERFVVEITSCPEIKVFHSEEVWYKKGQWHNPKIKHKKPDGWVYQNALPLCCISISTAIVHRDVFNQIGNFDESLPACEDYDFWLRVTHDFKVKLIEEYLTLKDGGRSDQLSLSIWGLDRYRIKGLKKMLQSGRLTREEREETFAVFKKKCTIFAQGAKKRGKIEEAESYLKLVAEFA